MEVMVNLEEVKEFIESDEFINFVLSKTTNIGTGAFILQTVLQEIDRLKKEEEETENV